MITRELTEGQKEILKLMVPGEGLTSIELSLRAYGTVKNFDMSLSGRLAFLKKRGLVKRVFAGNGTSENHWFLTDEGLKTQQQLKENEAITNR